MWFIGVEVEQETSAPPPKKNPGSALVFVVSSFSCVILCDYVIFLFRPKKDTRKWKSYPREHGSKLLMQRTSMYMLFCGNLCCVCDFVCCGLRSEVWFWLFHLPFFIPQCLNLIMEQTIIVDYISIASVYCSWCRQCNQHFICQTKLNLNILGWKRRMSSFSSPRHH